MKVIDVSPVYGVYEKQSVVGKPVQRTSAASKSDKLSLSRDAKDFQAVMRGLKTAPDTRTEKVAELSQKYDSGSYVMDSRSAAEGLLRSGVLFRRP